jgi:outer membrane lipoprotein-sorting protein
MFFDFLSKGLLLHFIKREMKNRKLFFFLLFFTTTTFAQTDKQAQTILNGLSSKYKSYSSIKATFSISIENEKDKSKQSQSGTLYLKGNKYKLQIVGQEIISDGKTRWTYVKDANEVQIDNQKKDEGSITPTNIFTVYEKGWFSKYIGEKKVKKSTYQYIELVPAEAKSKNIFKVKLTINKAEKSIVSAVIYDKNGAIQTISVDKFIPNGANEEGIYIFKSENYPGSEVVDLR